MIVIRPCDGLDELEACVQLQIQTWGYEASYVTPRKAFKVVQRVGGQVLGAFDTELPGAQEQGGPESLVGFLMAQPGVKICNGKPMPYLHSDMMAVREAYRNRGLGVQLKMEQRIEALSRGIRLIEWTFDPLEIKNAFLNIHKLGAIVCCYLVNFYGVSSSQLQGGLPTDRLVAEWRLDSSRVQAILERHPAAARIIEEKIQERILVPASIYQWKASEASRERALTVQLENRNKFQKAFSQGLAALGFSRDAEGNGIFELGLRPQTEQAENPKERKNL